jgi:hypothetical protein
MDKGAQENKLVVGSSEILYADAEGRVKIFTLIRLLQRRNTTIVLGRTITMFQDRLSLQRNIKHLRRIAQPIWLFKT